MVSFRPKPIREWAITKGASRIFSPVREAYNRLIDNFYFNRKISVSKLKNEKLRTKLRNLGVNELSTQHGDLLRNEDVFNQAFQQIAFRKGKKVDYFDVFEAQQGGNREADIAAIKHYYRVNTGKDLKTILYAAPEKAKPLQVKVDQLSAEHAAWMHQSIVQKLRQGNSLSSALDFHGPEKPDLSSAPKTAIQRPQPKATRAQWVAASAATAGTLALGAGLMFGVPDMMRNSSQTQDVVVSRAAGQKALSPAERAVKANYRQSKNFGVNLVGMAQAWHAHKKAIGAPEARNPEYYMGKFVGQWESYVQRLAKHKGFKEITPAHVRAFLTSSGRTSGGPTQINAILKAAFNK